MKKETWKKVAAVGAAAVLCLSLFACGSSKSDDQAKKDTEEKKPTAQDFTTKDGKYKITADSDWSEPDTYSNDESALEIEIAGGLTSISIIDQSKSGQGIQQGSYRLYHGKHRCVQRCTDRKHQRIHLRQLQNHRKRGLSNRENHRNENGYLPSFY